MRPILVTGAQGFVGRFFVACALAAGERVIGLGRSPRSGTSFTHTISIDERCIPSPLPDELRDAVAAGSYEYFQCDLLDAQRLREVLRSTRPRAVVHLASALRDDPPSRLVQTNIAGTVALIDALRAEAADIESVVFGSSAAVYGQPRLLPVSEASELRPIEPYGITKCAAEQLAAIHADDLRARVAFARIFNVVGAGQDERHVCGRFAAQAVSARAGNRAALRVGDLAPTRDFIDVRDVASALLALVRCEGASGPFNVCSGKETAIGEVLALTLRSAGLPEHFEVESTYRRAADPSRSCGDNSKLRALGWAAQFSLEQSIADVVACYEAMRSRAISGASSA